jgi:ribosomal protein S18 acetylase RimI-like enzyme
MSVNIEGPCSGKGRVCEPILRALPAWFGIEASLACFIREIDALPTWLACEDEQVVGFMSVKQHTPYAAELYCMGLLPKMHRKGIGRALLVEAQEWLTDHNVEYLQVKSLGPSAGDENYAMTRAFYDAMGFRPLEEFKQIWDEHNPCLIMVMRL